MVVDPFSALGLAGNVVQFLDFGSKLISESHAIYNNASGAGTANVELELVYTDLSHLTKALENPPDVSSNEGELRQLASSCRSVAVELLDIVQALKVNKNCKHRKWRSFRQALKTVWKQSDIDTLQARLDSFRGQLTVRLVAILADRQSGLNRELQLLISENKRMDINQTRTIDGLADAIESLRQFMENLLSTAATKLDLDHLFLRLTELRAQASAIAKEQQLLGSLPFKAMTTRQSKIPEAHACTFDWIFDPECEVGFAEWLRHGDGIYWISGKPGSGKSTLTKHLYRHSQTKEALGIWADGQHLVTASFFFWSIGTPMQKSQEGLLRSLLFEILRQCPNLIPLACPTRWTTSGCIPTDQDDWDLDELTRTLGQVFDQGDASAKFCFFIDGLDEYEGRHMDIIRILQTLGTGAVPSVKIVVSSRPWNVFEDAFGRDPSRKLYLEDLTRDDIELYVRANLEKHTTVTMFSLENSGYEELIVDIINRAQGVFLWVFLVIRSLCDGLINGDDVHLLHDRVRRLPTDLEKYFKLIIQRVPEEYRVKMAVTFQAALHASEPLTLMSYSFLDERDLDYAIDLSVRPFDRHDIYNRHTAMDRRINRYNGLLEIQRDPAAIDYFGFRVEFFHRTVHDFLQLQEIQSLLRSYLDRGIPGFNANNALCKVYLANLKTMPMTRSLLIFPGIFQEVLRTLMYHARQVELETDASPVEVLNELEDTAAELSMMYDNCRILWSEDTNDNGRCKTFLEFAIHSGLHLYVGEALDGDHNLIHKCPRPLLNSALRFSSSLGDGRGEVPDMVRFLLQQGADPNQRFAKSTVFGNYLLAISSTKDGISWVSTNIDVVRQRQEVLEILLHHGANPNTAYGSGRTVAAWGHLVMGVQKLNTTRKISQAHLEILKMLFQYGADPNLPFDSHRQDTIWESFLRSIHKVDANEASAGRLRIRFEITKCFLLHGADIDIYLDVPGIRYLSVSQIFSRAFSRAETQELEDIMRCERRNRGKRRCCGPYPTQWFWKTRRLVEPLWLLADSFKNRWLMPQAPIQHEEEDERSLPPFTFRSTNTSRPALPQVQSCTIYIKKSTYRLRVPEMTVFCIFQFDDILQVASVTIEVYYDNGIFGSASFDAINTERLSVEVCESPNGVKSTSRVSVDSFSRSAIGAAAKVGRISIQVRPNSGTVLSLNKPTHYRPLEGSSQLPWLLDRLRSRAPSELLETLEVFLFAIKEARHVSLVIDLSRTPDFERFSSFAGKINGDGDT
ncbi:hypothetical protein BCR34DRAFT_225132 [Clohesyomyces aquaticus]|uniref:NACHT domain-containing protein n=1 Tax=Clohesyomyces aquaticus TaxID=1231657 RepID=A0A1Y1ZY45_9PLEO|nr:hypothetical protein BCR34DRAFT_225132 [Clohesyomyces aquaticus]